MIIIYHGIIELKKGEIRYHRIHDKYAIDCSSTFNISNCSSLAPNNEIFSAIIYFYGKEEFF